MFHSLDELSLMKGLLLAIVTHDNSTLTIFYVEKEFKVHGYTERATKKLQQLKTIISIISFMFFVRIQHYFMVYMKNFYGILWIFIDFLSVSEVWSYIL